MLRFFRNMSGTAVLLFVVVGCSVLPGPKQVVQDKYLLEYNPSKHIATAANNLPVMIITVPRAHGGYDTSRIAYMKKQYGLRYYVSSRWADTPARMLAPLLAEAMNNTGEFQAVYGAPGALAAKYRLDSELISFHQNFISQPSEVQISLRAQLVDLGENRVLASQLFEITEVSSSEDSYGGVQAANRATARLMSELAQFCVDRKD